MSVRLAATGKTSTDPSSLYRQPSDFNSVQTMPRDASNMGYDRPTQDQFHLNQFDPNNDDRSEQTIPSMKNPTIL